MCTIGNKAIYAGKRKESSVPPELSVLADGHHDQQVSQDAHQHDQRQEADQGHPLWHAVAMEPARRHNNNNGSDQVRSAKTRSVSATDKSDEEFAEENLHVKILLSSANIMKWSCIRQNESLLANCLTPDEVEESAQKNF